MQCQGHELGHSAATMDIRLLLESLIRTPNKVSTGRNIHWIFIMLFVQFLIHHKH